jgi:NitT/TauT family transport system permease protein
VDIVKNWLPIVIILFCLMALGYPLAFLFGLPLARKDLSDLRKWQKDTLTAQAPLDVSSTTSLPFTSVSPGSLLIQDNQPLDIDYTISDNTLTLSSPLETLVTWGKTLESHGFRYGNASSFGEAIPKLDPNRVLYAGATLLQEGSVSPVELPDGTLNTFTFNNSVKAILVDDQIFVSEEGLMDPLDSPTYKQNGSRFTLNRKPTFGSNIRALSADYTTLDASKGIIATSATYTQLREASSVVRLAETLQGDINGENRIFSFSRGNVVEADKERAVFVDTLRLDDAPERPKERVDGVQNMFTFTSEKGLVVVDGVLLEETKDYTRHGSSITFNQAPLRNAELRQYPDYYLSNSSLGEILLAVAPPAGSKIWTSQYTVYSKPACGSNLLQCFYHLPQHPMPFPHWIVRRIPAFFSKFPLNDERNVVRAMLYTTLGTLSSLVLGGIVGSLLAMLFVMIRPLERALLPWTIASQTIPIIALVPVMLLVLGNFGITIQTSLLPTALIGAYICFFPVVVSTVKGLRSVDPLILDLMNSYAATPLQVFRNVRFPAAVPFVFTGLKLGTAAALVGALVAETESNNKRGLGFQILGQVQTGNVADVWILLLISALLGVGLVSIVGFLQRVIAPWEHK